MQQLFYLVLNLKSSPWIYGLHLGCCKGYYTACGSITSIILSYCMTDITSLPKYPESND